MTIPFVFALAGGSFVFLGVMIVGFFAFALLLHPARQRHQSAPVRRHRQQLRS
jgi:hypothetical protein